MIPALFSSVLFAHGSAVTPGSAPARAPAPVAQAATGPAPVDPFADALAEARRLGQAKDAAGAQKALKRARPATLHERCELALTTGLLALWSGDFPVADDALHQATRLDPTFVDGYLAQADLALARGLPLDALAPLATARTLDPARAEAKLLERRALRAALSQAPVEVPRGPLVDRLLAAADFAGEDADAALATVAAWPAPERARWFGGFTTTPPTPFLLRIASMQREDGDAAAAFYRLAAVAGQRPELATATLDHGCAASWNLLEKKRGAEVVALTTQALKLVPGPPELAQENIKNSRLCLLRARGSAALSTQSRTLAKEAYAAAIAEGPADFGTFAGAFWTALDDGSLVEAGDFLQRATASAKTPADREALPTLIHGLQIRSANQAMDRHEFAASERLSRAALVTMPSSVDAPLLLGSALLAQRRPQEARIALLAGTVKNPKALRLWTSLAQLPIDDDAVLTYAKTASALATSKEELFEAAVASAGAEIQRRHDDDAERSLRGLREQFPDKVEPLLGLARLRMQQGDYEAARVLYRQARALRADSFDAQLGFADASHALSFERDAFRTVEGALAGSKFPSPDAVGFLDRLREAHAPRFGVALSTSTDNGTNRSTTYAARSEFDLDKQWRLSVDANLRKAVTTNVNVHGEVVGFGTQLTVREGGTYTLVGRIGGQWMAADGTSGTLRPWLQAKATRRIGTKYQASLGYTSDAFSYTSGMIAAKLQLHTLAATANGPLLGPLSFYAEAATAIVTDGNARGLTFLSIYSDLTKSPTAKLGVNGQLLGFAVTSPRAYFSPARLVVSEAFGQLVEDDPNKTFIFNALAAVGLQKINQESTQPIYRFFLSGGVRFHRHLRGEVYGQLTNSASTSISGFRMYEGGVRLETRL
jgi:tetratricopeptide (TPR) repeat protein